MSNRNKDAIAAIVVRKACFPEGVKTDQERHDFLIYYAGVLEREADARPNSNVQWMRDGAARARAAAAAIDLRPPQGELFK